MTGAMNLVVSDEEDSTPPVAGYESQLAVLMEEVAVAQEMIECYQRTWRWTALTWASFLLLFGDLLNADFWNAIMAAAGAMLIAALGAFNLVTTDSWYSKVLSYYEENQSDSEDSDSVGGSNPGNMEHGGNGGDLVPDDNLNLLRLGGLPKFMALLTLARKKGSEPEETTTRLTLAHKFLMPDLCSQVVSRFRWAILFDITINCFVLSLSVFNREIVNTSTIFLAAGLILGSVEPWFERKVWVKFGLVRSKSAATILASFLTLFDMFLFAFIAYLAYRNAKAHWVLAPMSTSCEEQCGSRGCDSDSIEQITASNVERLVQSFDTRNFGWACSNFSAVSSGVFFTGATESLTCYYPEGKSSCSSVYSGATQICCCGLGGCELPQPN
jgi:hypothetical protein